MLLNKMMSHTSPDQVHPELSISHFDYRQYKKGIITTRLKIIVEYIISQASPTLRAVLKDQEFILEGEVLDEHKETELYVKFSIVPHAVEEELKKLHKKIVLKR